MQAAFDLIEGTWLSDGREWICGTEKGLSMADLNGKFSFTEVFFLVGGLLAWSSDRYIYQAIWPFDWVVHVDLYGSDPPEQLSSARYPKTHAWVARFQVAISAARTAHPPPTRIDGEQMLRLVLNSRYAEPMGEVDETDPVALMKGQIVEVWPTDSGMNHRNEGILVALNVNEVVIAKTIANTTGDGHDGVLVHFPRMNFRIQTVGVS